jgi:hypothetical protein
VRSLNWKTLWPSRFSPSSLLLVHLVGLAIGLGAATAKLVLLFRCRADGAFVPTYLAVVRPITRRIILGLVLLLLSGSGFMAIGHSFTPRLVTKLVLVAAIFVSTTSSNRRAQARRLVRWPSVGFS